MGHFRKRQCDTLAFKSEKYYTYMHKGIVFYFYALLRSGYYSLTDLYYALHYSGDISVGGVGYWQAVRPALQLAQNKSF